MNTEDERKQFESWALRQYNLTKTPAGCYAFSSASAGWNAWQARAALSAPAAPSDQGNALKFADHIINGMFEGGDWDGGDVQELAVNYGLLKPETMQGPCNEDGDCQCAQNGAEFPSTCYRKTYVNRK